VEIRRQEIMELLFARALAGEGMVKTNPLVAAGLVKDGELLELAAHRQFGGLHAEAALLNKYTGSLQGVELYCTLEPCVHQGKTAPCTERILKTDIEEVTFAHIDPHPRVQGRGMKKLLKAGLTVTTPVCRSQYRWLNRAYFYNQVAGLPWLEAKLALSVDGYIATESHHSQWLSGPESRHYTHLLRSRVDAVMVGAETVRRDNPSLTDRVTGRESQPGAIIVTTRPQTLSPSLTLLSERAAETTIVVPSQIEPALGEKLEESGVTLVRSELHDGRYRWTEVLPRLYRAGFGRILVEGGGGLVGDLISAQLLNELHLFNCGHVLGSGIRSARLSHKTEKVFNAPRFRLLEQHRFGEDIYIRRLSEQSLRRVGFNLTPHPRLRQRLTGVGFKG